MTADQAGAVLLGLALLAAAAVVFAWRRALADWLRRRYLRHPAWWDRAPGRPRSESGRPLDRLFIQLWVNPLRAHGELLRSERYHHAAVIAYALTFGIAGLFLLVMAGIGMIR